MGACCGNDKPSTVAPGAASGRKRSVLLLVLAIGIAIGFQYGIASYIVNVSFTNYVTSAWLDIGDFQLEVVRVYAFTFSRLDVSF